MLLGSAVLRLLRIRSLYYQLVAVAILGFAGTGIPLFGSLYFEREWHQDVGDRGHIYAIIGLASFLGLPVAYLVGDRLFRRAPEAPLKLAALSITLYGGLFAISLHLPELWMVVAVQFLGQAAIAPLSISIFQTLAATAPPEMRSICFAMFGVYALVFGGFAGAVVLGAISDARGVTFALTLIGPVCAVGGLLLYLGSGFVRRDITLVIEDVLERYAEGRRRQGGRSDPRAAGAQPRLLLRGQPGAVRCRPRGGRGGDPGAARHQRRRQVDPPAGGRRPRPSAPRGHPHLRSQLHLPRARADHRPARRAARRRAHDLPRSDRSRQPADRWSHAASELRAVVCRVQRRRRPVPGARRQARSAPGTLSGGEQQMLAWRG